MSNPPRSDYFPPLIDAATLAPPHDPTHARLVSALVHLLFGLGFRSIHTDHGLPARPSICHRPDVTARSGRDTLSLFAVETTSSLESERATQRLHALASETEGDELWLAVPPEARPAAIRRLQELELPGRVIGV